MDGRGELSLGVPGNGWWGHSAFSASHLPPPLSFTRRSGEKEVYDGQTSHGLATDFWTGTRNCSHRGSSSSCHGPSGRMQWGKYN